VHAVRACVRVWACKHASACTNTHRGEEGAGYSLLCVADWLVSPSCIEKPTGRFKVSGQLCAVTA